MKEQSSLTTKSLFLMVLFASLLAPSHQVSANSTWATSRTSPTLTETTGTSQTWTASTPSESTTTAPIPTPPSPPIVEVTRVSYRGLIIRIYADKGVTNPGWFYFKPLVQLDPKRIVAHHFSVLDMNIVSFNIEMWNSELRRKVLARLQSLKDKQFNMINIGEEDIYVMPFEKVMLTNRIPFGSSGDTGFGVKWQERHYRRQSENFQFYVFCDSTVTANGLAEDFRRNPEFLLDKWQMTLKCRGLENELMETYPVSTSYFTSLPQQQKKLEYGYNHQVAGSSLHYHDATTGQVVA